MKQKLFYFLSAFICGAAVMSVEMSGTRLLAPYFGTSLFVWTNVIGVIMMALTLGYALGGKMADRHPHAMLYFFWIGVTGIWVMGIPFLAALILPPLSHGFGDLENSLRLGSLAAVLLLLAFPMVLLGMVVPFTVRLMAEKIQNIGTLSGRVSAISAMGSLLGTFSPAFILIPTLGTTKTFIFIGLSLCFLAACGLRNIFLMILTVLGGGLFWLVPPVYAAANVVASMESPYGFVFVTENGRGVRALHIDTALGTQSFYDPENILPPESYYYGYFGVLPTMVEDAKTVLILGHAGGSFTRIFNEYYPELEITGIEIDPVVTQIAQEKMGMDHAQVEIIHADARQFLLNTDQKYDLILVDAYHGANIPAHLATVEFFRLCQERLNEGGLVALNAASTTGDFLDTLRNSLAASFPSVLSFAIPGSFNSVLVARDEPEEVKIFFETPPPDLQSFYAQLFLPEKWLRSFYQESMPTFHDEKLSEVELKNEKMFMQLLSTF